MARSLIFRLYQLKYLKDIERWSLTANGERVKNFAKKDSAIAALGGLIRRPGVVEVSRQDGTIQGYRYYDHTDRKRV